MTSSLLGIHLGVLLFVDSVVLSNTQFLVSKYVRMFFSLWKPYSLWKGDIYFDFLKDAQAKDAQTYLYILTCVHKKTL